MKDLELWQHISEYQLDHSQAVFPFSARLARDNGWTRAFAHRVIEEYKKFVYLAMVADHEVTPSDEVDQAWHLHMTYTRDYWGSFTEMLGRPLHHGPTRGGQLENHRYAENYAATLRTYQDEFASLPPAALWPPAAVRFGRAVSFKRVNSADVWLVPKHLVAKAAAVVVAAVVGWQAAAPAAVADTPGQSLFPSSPGGWAAFIFILCVVAFIIFWADRNRKYKGDGKHKKKKNDGSGCSTTSGCGTGCGGGCGGGGGD